MKNLPKKILKELSMSALGELSRPWTSIEVEIAEAWLETLPHDRDFLSDYMDDFSAEDNLKYVDFTEKLGLKKKVKLCEKLRSLVWTLHYVRYQFGEEGLCKVLDIVNKENQ